MHIRPLFPIPLGSVSLNRKFSTEEISFIESLDFIKKGEQNNKRSKDSYILENEVLKDLKSFILTNINLYLLATNPLPKNVEIYITQSWVNHNSANEAHVEHYHQNSVVSGVLYFDVDPLIDSIIFLNFPKSVAIEYEPTHWNEFNSDILVHPVKNGQLLLFPSNLIHKVDATNSVAQRISLSFNTFLKGHLGDELSLTELIL